MQDRKHIPLQAKYCLVIIFAFILAMMTKYLSDTVGYAVYEKYYMSNEKVEARLKENINSLSDYVASSGISSYDAAEIKKFCRDKRHITVTVYRDDGEMLYQTNGKTVWSGTEYNDLSDDIGYISDDIKYSNGDFKTEISENYNTGISRIIFFIGFGLGMLVLLAVILIFNGMLISRITKMSKNVRAVKNGKLNADIKFQGNDEISELGRDVNEMRKSIINHYESEQDAWNANRELITSISHDIRTPLTSMLLYLDMIVSPDTAADKKPEYAQICKDNAYRLKDMTDSLFRYFMVYGQKDVKVEMEEYDAGIIFDQLIGERTIALEQNGFRFDTVCAEGKYIIRTDISLLNRILDNVFSNAQKYSDKSKPIYITLDHKDGEISFILTNHIAPNESKAESTKVGLKTCGRIAKMISCTFITKESNGIFECKITMPCKEQKNDSTEKK